jgi:hypothetical protein
VRTDQFDQPPKPATLLDGIRQSFARASLDWTPSFGSLTNFERRLSARSPFQQTPGPSYLTTWGRSWDLAPQFYADGTISWSSSGIFDDVRRPGTIEFNFFNVTVNRPALILISVTTMAESGRTGSLEITGNAPITGTWPVPVTGGYSDHTLALTVNLPLQPQVTLRLIIGEGVMLFYFHELTYALLS